MKHLQTNILYFEKQTKKLTIIGGREEYKVISTVPWKEKPCLKTTSTLLKNIWSLFNLFDYDCFIS